MKHLLTLLFFSVLLFSCAKIEKVKSDENETIIFKDTLNGEWGIIDTFFIDQMEMVEQNIPDSSVLKNLKIAGCSGSAVFGRKIKNCNGEFLIISYPLDVEVVGTGLDSTAVVRNNGFDQNWYFFKNQQPDTYHDYFFVTYCLSNDFLIKFRVRLYIEKC